MDEAQMAAEIERGLRETHAVLAAFPRARRMEYLRLLVEEHPRLAGKCVGERIQHLRIVMQAIDAAAVGIQRGTSASRRAD